jgi:hypothetical protein
MTIAGTALDAVTSDFFFGSGARVSVALPGFSKPRAEEGLHTRSSDMFYDNESTIYK